MLLTLAGLVPGHVFEVGESRLSLRRLRYDSPCPDASLTVTCCAIYMRTAIFAGVLVLVPRALQNSVSFKRKKVYFYVIKVCFGYSLCTDLGFILWSLEVPCKQRIMRIRLCQVYGFFICVTPCIFIKY
jgi:hypothetical protein